VVKGTVVGSSPEAFGVWRDGDTSVVAALMVAVSGGAGKATRLALIPRRRNIVLLLIINQGLQVFI
jgi:hypothetical protein